MGCVAIIVQEMDGNCKMFWIALRMDSAYGKMGFEVIGLNKSEYLRFCESIEGAVVDQPFEGNFSSYIARHQGSRKWFAAVLEHQGREFVNLKCDPIEAEFLRSAYKGIQPGYHMNKTHWNSVYFESDVNDELFKHLTMNSFHLTEK